MTGGQGYGPVSYYELGRAYPRDKLRDPFRRLGQTLRRWLTPLIGPPATPAGRVIPLTGIAATAPALIGSAAAASLVGRATVPSLTGTNVG